jgi:hypothetical protein
VLLEVTLTENQLLVLSQLPHHESQETKSSLIRNLCKQQGLSEPTARRAITLFHELGIISCGTQVFPGRLFKLTLLGKKVTGVSEDELKTQGKNP